MGTMACSRLPSASVASTANVPLDTLNSLKLGKPTLRVDYNLIRKRQRELVDFFADPPSVDSFHADDRQSRTRNPSTLSRLDSKSLTFFATAGASGLPLYNFHF